MVIVPNLNPNTCDNDLKGILNEGFIGWENYC
jgi:hypothetical protein